MMDCQPFIFGIAGTALTDEEKIFLAAVKPLGVILFARNIQTLDQVQELCASLREAAQNPNLWIAIDQEGGRVARLKPPLWPELPPAKKFGDMYVRDKDSALDEAYTHFYKIGQALRELGITMNCAPVLDLPVPGAHDVIGDRAFSADPMTMSLLGRQAVNGLNDALVFPVIKHIPGHGRSMADSHLELPRVDTSLDEMRRTDFAPFQFLRDAPFAMTAHILYSAVDADLPATLSPKLIANIIRGEIGFRGLLMSDDLGMKALKGNFADLTRQTLQAGCDIVLHCSGNMDEMKQIAEAHQSGLSPTAQKRLQDNVRNVAA